jgi:hypothetical protein
MINIFLQMLSFEEIAKLFQIPVDIQGVETVTSFVPYVIMGIFGFLAFIGLRIYKNLQEYPNDEARIGKMKIHWQGNYTFEGNMSRYTLPLLPSTMEELKQTNWFKKSGEELESLLQSRKLFLYEMKITDFEEAFDLKGKKESALIISSGDLGSEKYAWEDTKGKFSWGTLRKEKMKNVFAHSSSRYFDIKTIDDNIKDVWIVAPIPISENGERFGYEISEDDEKYSLDVSILPNMPSLAQVVPYLVAVARSNELIRSKNIQLDKLKHLLEERDSKLNRSQRENDILRAISASEPLIGEKNPKMPAEKPSPFIWFIMFGIAGLVGTRLPDSVSQLRELDPMISGFLCVIALAGIYYMTSRKKEDEVELE